MPLFDTHNHLYFSCFQDKDAAIKKAQDNDISNQILVGIDEYSCLSALDLAQKHTGLFVSLGLHPCDTENLGTYNPEYHQYPGMENYRPKIKDFPSYFLWLEKLFLDHQNLVVAFGETGFDRYHQDTSELLKRQEESFEFHFQLCKKFNKTLIIHSRGAPEETLNFLKKQQRSNFPIVWHCFCEDLEVAQTATNDLGVSLGIGGVITYPQSETLRQVIAQIPMDFLVTETDSPFLVPHPYRKKGETINHPSFLDSVIQTIASVHKKSIEETQDKLFQNALKLFQLD